MYPFPIVSADDHMEVCALPRDLWTLRLPREMAGRAPHVIETPDGFEWRFGQHSWGPWGRASPELSVKPSGFVPGDANSRIQDLSADGIHAQVIYAPPGGIPISDESLAEPLLRTFNDWGLEFMSGQRDRLTLLAQLPSHSPLLAAAELLRSRKLGYKGAQLQVLNQHVPVFEPDWEPFWEVANDCAIPISMHICGGMHSIRSTSRRSWRHPAMISALPLQLDEIIAGIAFSGILERHPSVRVVFGEAGLGWLPYFFQRMDHEFRKHSPRTDDYRIRELPSFYLNRQAFFTWEEDDVGIELICQVGEANVMWASDYPHIDSTWPNSLEAIRSIADRCDASTLARIVSRNAIDLYGLEFELNT